MGQTFDQEVINKRLRELAYLNSGIKIVFEDESGQIHDYGLRGRLVSNNGMTAMVGKSTVNKSSIPVFKVQQDKVTSIFKRIPKTKLTII